MVTAVESVTVQSEAALTVLDHAKSHPTESVSGFLLGQANNNDNKKNLVVSSAVPVCHGTPTLPIVETSMGLVEQLEGTIVVGWYTVPELLDDETAGPVALRIAANLACDTLEPILLVLNNIQLSKKGSDLFQGYGRDFGNQWLEKIATKTNGESQLCDLLLQQERRMVYDWLDHLQDATRTWYPNPEISKLAQKL